MASAPSSAQEPAGAPGAGIGPGRVVLVVGPSGAGKDTLINLARAELAGNPDIVFATRIVTRPSSSSEDNVAVSADAFAAAALRGEFALTWEAHGLSYGIPISIDTDVQAGRTVVLNTSRTLVTAIQNRYMHAAVAYVDAPLHLRAERLAARGRESLTDVQNRLARSAADFDGTHKTHRIQNIGDPAEAARQFVGILTLRS
jgi:ribose 1,5-bisphosphokinase